MAKNISSSFEDKRLTKGQLRKLNALRKSLGDEIANKAFAEWLQTQPSATAPESERDKNADLISSTLWDLVDKGKLAIPRGGYVVRRGRGRIVVERPAES